MKGIKLLLGVFAMTMASSVFAAITFDFTEYNSPKNSLTFESEGYEVKATGWARYYNTNSFTQTPLGSSYGGLFIKRGTFDNHQIDGKGRDEMVIFDFLGKAVKLISATFSYVSNNDQFDLFADNDSTGPLDFVLRGDPDGSWPHYTDTYNFNSPVHGSRFGFLARESDDDFKIKSITVAYVPEPASITLLALGLIALAFIPVN